MSGPEPAAPPVQEDQGPVFAIPGLESLSSQLTASINASHVRVGGSRTTLLERDLTLYDRKAMQYLSNLALKASTSTTDPNGNPDAANQAPTLLTVEDPLSYWSNQVNNIRYSWTTNVGVIYFCSGISRLQLRIEGVCRGFIVLPCHQLCFRENLFSSRISLPKPIKLHQSFNA